MPNIPKIIWQTHNFKYDEMPDFVKKNMTTWKNLNPGWEHRYVDHEQRKEMLSKYDEIMEFYDDLIPMFQADIWRYVVMFEHGGVYCDMDSICIKPLDYMLSFIDSDVEFICIDGNKPMLTNNANFASIKQSNILQKIVLQSINVEKKYGGEYFLYIFVKNVEKEYQNNKKTISFDFTSEDHSIEYKSIFNENFEIDYYGTKMLYKDFVKNNNLDFI